MYSVPWYLLLFLRQTLESRPVDVTAYSMGYSKQLYASASSPVHSMGVVSNRSGWVTALQNDRVQSLFMKYMRDETRHVEQHTEKRS